MTSTFQDAAQAATAVDRIHQAAKIADSDIIDPNPEYLTLDEIDKVEEMLGGPMDMMGRMPRRGPALRIVATIIKQRTDPSFTLAQAGSLRIRFGETTPVPPTDDNDSEPS